MRNITIALEVVSNGSWNASLMDGTELLEQANKPNHGDALRWAIGKVTKTAGMRIERVLDLSIRQALDCAMMDLGNAQALINELEENDEERLVYDDTRRLIKAALREEFFEK